MYVQAGFPPNDDARNFIYGWLTTTLRVNVITVAAGYNVESWVSAHVGAWCRPVGPNADDEIIYRSDLLITPQTVNDSGFTMDYSREVDQLITIIIVPRLNHREMLEQQARWNDMAPGIFGTQEVNLLYNGDNAPSFAFFGDVIQPNIRQPFDYLTDYYCTNPLRFDPIFTQQSYLLRDAAEISKYCHMHINGLGNVERDDPNVLLPRAWADEFNTNFPLYANGLPIWCRPNYPHSQTRYDFALTMMTYWYPEAFSFTSREQPTPDMNATQYVDTRQAYVPFLNNIHRDDFRYAG